MGISSRLQTRDESPLGLSVAGHRTSRRGPSPALAFQPDVFLDRATLSPALVLSAQRMIGNRALGSLLAPVQRQAEDEEDPYSVQTLRYGPAVDVGMSLQRQDDDAGETAGSTRTSVALTCPGTRENSVTLTNELTTPYGIRNPANTGGCAIFLVAMSGGTAIEDLRMEPGAGFSSYTGPRGTDRIMVACSMFCTGRGELTYDIPLG